MTLNPSASVRSFILTTVWAATLLTTLAALPARAAEPKSPLGSQWKAVPQALVDAGVTHAGDLDLQKLLRDGQQIKWSEKRSEEAPWQANGRKSAYFNSETQTVTIDPQTTKDDQSARPQLELHEVMGALKINDHNYSASTALELIHNTKDLKQREKLIENFSSGVLNKRNLQTRGGGTSVSGGGDLNALILKRLTFQKILSAKNPSLDFLTNFPSIAFEPDYEPKRQIITIDYIWREKDALAKGRVLPDVPLDPTKNFQELIVVRVPALAWRTKKLQPQILNDLTDLVTSLFAVNDQAELVSYQLWSGCNGVNAGLAPKSQKGAAVVIQQIRLTLRQGCTTGLYGYHRSSATYDYRGKFVERDLEYTPVYAKEPPSEAVVKTRNGYICTVTKNNFKVAGISFVPAQGVASGALIGNLWSTLKSGIVNDNLVGKVIVSPSGLIEGIYFGLGSQASSLKNLISNETERADLKVKVGNDKLRLVCERGFVEQ